MGKVVRVFTSTLCGIEARSVEVEVRCGELKTQEAFVIVGLGDNAVKESKERVRSALYGIQSKVPSYIVVNLAPAEIKKEGTSFDLSIAVGILIGSGSIAYRKEFDAISVHGELGLDGKIRSVRGIVAKALEAKREGRQLLIVPQDNLAEARLICPDIAVGVTHLLELKTLLQGERPRNQTEMKMTPLSVAAPTKSLGDIIGQDEAKRAIIIAAAGSHNIILVGPPGCGKSMLAERMPLLLPALTEEEMLEVVQIHSSLGASVTPYLHGIRPYRSPHHSVSDAGLLGGGSIPKPGEITYAHRGVLFLDEFPEYRRSALEGMRVPLESGEIHIVRAKGATALPGKFQLVAAMNPCPCGRLGMMDPPCGCTRSAVAGYIQRLSGPILDRIDLQVSVKPVALTTLTKSIPVPSCDEEIKKTISNARQRQYLRWGKLNNELSLKELFSDSGGFEDESKKQLEKIAQIKKCSARGYVRVARVARTIADLDMRQSVVVADVAEAFSYRSIDRIREYAQLA